MRLLFALLVSTYLIADAFATLNPYRRFKEFSDNGDVGEALFLTPYIKAGKFNDAKRLASVEGDQFLGVVSYSGYLTVEPKYNSNLFFWFFPAAQDAENEPVVLWLQGGPGASSLFGLFEENGPFVVNEDLNLTHRQYSWHTNHNLLYIDNPAGTGFSFTDSDDGYAKNEFDVRNNLYEAMSQFFQLFSELRHNKFYVFGESYGGKYVPALSMAIHMRNANTTDDKKINLKGLAMGNGLSDPIHQLKYGDYLYQLGLIDWNGLSLFHQYEKKGKELIEKRDFAGAFDIFDQLIDMDQFKAGSLFKNLTGLDSYFNYVSQAGDTDYMGKFLQSSSTRKALHVGNYTFHDLEGENKVEEHMKNDVMDSVAPWVAELLNHYRVMIYNGQLDVIVAYPLTSNYLQHLKFKEHEQYLKEIRRIWRVGNDVAGYVKEVGNIVDVLVRNAGHMAPADQPKWCYDMLMRFTHGKGFAKAFN